MDSTRLKVKVGDHEFEAEGPADLLRDQFNAWKELIQIGVVQPSSAAKPRPADPPSSEAASPKTDNGSPVSLAVFDVDRVKQTITLKAHPTTDTRDADAALLLMYAFRRVFDVHELIVGKLKDALERSGLRVGRIDRTMDTYAAQSLVLKTGRGPGGKYRLSMTGLQKAESLAREMSEKIV